MEGFFTLVGQIFVILCIQSLLESMVNTKKQAHIQKIIGVGCYVATLVVVVQFMEKYLMEVMKAVMQMM
ncbi:hypothetical protein [Chakrabartyella piscis]|uniref:hypothetical protein n=1 Tax=Chakrabartyella piscis TaxID=2918914 RepID=UPI002958D317|nr:hypothetical protein [Chakrabartyella piscis]